MLNNKKEMYLQIISKIISQKEIKNFDKQIEAIEVLKIDNTGVGEYIDFKEKNNFIPLSIGERASCSLKINHNQDVGAILQKVNGELFSLELYTYGEDIWPKIIESID